MKHALLNPNDKRVIIMINLSKWTEYCPEPYIQASYGGNAFLDCNQPQDEDTQPILRKEVECASKTEKSSKFIVYSGDDNLPAKFVQADGKAMIDVLTENCKRICRTGI